MFHSSSNHATTSDVCAHDTNCYECTVEFPFSDSSLQRYYAAICDKIQKTNYSTSIQHNMTIDSIVVHEINSQKRTFQQESLVIYVIFGARVFPCKKYAKLCNSI